MNTRVMRYGDRAWLAEVATHDVDLLAHYARQIPGVNRIVPAARTVLVSVNDSATAEEIAKVVEALAKFDPELVSAVVQSEGREHVIDVTYDGEDLNEIASSCGMSPETVIALHSATQYRVAFCGFAPGFAYLTGLDPRLQLARRPSPRASVPSGSIAIAAEYTAVYPRRSPGGWLLLGRTSAVMWDLARERPSLLEPGDLVRFRAVRAVLGGDHDDH